MLSRPPGPSQGNGLPFKSTAVPARSFIESSAAAEPLSSRSPFIGGSCRKTRHRLCAAVHETIDGRFDVLLFTSAHQLDCVLEVAEAAGEKEAWLQAARACVIASIGPTASEALRDSGLPVDVEARPTRMGQLVRAAIEAAPAILAAKRAIGRAHSLC